MSWLETLKTGVISFLEPNSNKVLLVDTKPFDLKHVHCREECLVMYAPSSKSDKFEILLQISFDDRSDESINKALSLCRFKDQAEAETRYLLYKDKIPTLVSKITKLLSAVSDVQAICDTILEHPSWNLAHLVVCLKLNELLSEPRVLLHINTEDDEGISPLQLAIQSCNDGAVHELLNYDVNINHFDNACNSLLHTAANSNGAIVKLLCEKSANLINSRNSSGHTPLHVACLADKTDCVAALLEAGADVNIEATQRNLSKNMPGLVGNFMKEFSNEVQLKEMKFGGTPLHWSCSPNVISALVKKGVNINSLNFDQKSALHIMVLRNRFDCVLKLLMLKADPNICDKEGNTPLHFAVKERKEMVIKTLLIFGADPSIKNTSGATSRHAIKCDNNNGDRIINYLHSVGAPRCTANMVGCTPGCKFDDSYIGIGVIPPLCPLNRDVINQMLFKVGCAQAMKRGAGDAYNHIKGGRLLSLDGGGIRGLVLLCVLMEIEFHTGKKIVDCFDWIAGTSTGGIVALGLGQGMSIHELMCMYMDMKNSVFSGRRPYDINVLEKNLRDTFGDEARMTDIKYPKIIVTGVLADRQPIDLHLFRNYDSANVILDIPYCGAFLEPQQPCEQLIWTAARSTGAAPTYFASSNRFLDGGLIANNPTLDAMTEIHEYNSALLTKGYDGYHPLSVVVSVGTGLMPVCEITKPVDVFLPERWFDASKLMLGISALGKMLVDQATQADGRVVDRARSWCSMIGVPYFRFSPQLNDDVEMDEKRDDVIVNMMFDTKVYMYSMRHELCELVRILSSDDRPDKPVSLIAGQN